MQSPAVLLDDSQVQDFIMKGYLVLTPSLSFAFHQAVLEKIKMMNPSRKDNPGNNILPVLPELNLVYEDPVVRGMVAT